MARKKDSPQKAALREMMSTYLKENDVKIKDGVDVNSIMRDMMSVILEGALDAKMNEELGYSKYDYAFKFNILRSDIKTFHLLICLLSYLSGNKQFLYA